MGNSEDWFARKPSSAISPFELNNEGKGEALVLRYARCNLRCPLCYAWRYAWNSQIGYQYKIQTGINAIDNLRLQANRKIVWVRIQGGEPCLNYDRILNTINFAVQALLQIYRDNLNYYNNIKAVIQTNANGFSTLSGSQILKIKNYLAKLLNSLNRGKIIFEVSFKSANDSNILRSQLNGFGVLLSQVITPLWNEGLNNIAVYPIAGLGPSIDSHNSWLIPIDPSYLPQEIPLFHPSTWSIDFKNMLNNFTQNIVPSYVVYHDFCNNPKTQKGGKIAIEELEATPFQTSWISGYAGRYAQFNVTVPPVTNLLRKFSNNCDPKWYALFRRNNNWLDVLDQIPVSRNPNSLLQMVQQLNNVFYPSHPIGHYPYL